MCEIWDAQNGVILSVKIGSHVFRTKGTFSREKVMEAAKLVEEMFIIPPMPPATTAPMVARRQAVIVPENEEIPITPISVKQRAATSPYTTIDKVHTVPIEKEPLEKLFEQLENLFTMDDVNEILRSMYPDNSDHTIRNKCNAYVKHLISNDKAKATTQKKLGKMGSHVKVFELKRFKGPSHQEVTDQLEIEKLVNQSKVNKTIEL